MLRHNLLCVCRKHAHLLRMPFRVVNSVKISTSCVQFQESDILNIPTTYLGEESGGLSPQRLPLPMITGRKIAFPPPNKAPQQAWLESLATVDNEKLGLVDLHPDVFATFPRVDVIYWNIYWQQMFRKIDYRFVPNRAEARGGGRKPWPQKGTGRARHGSIRSPLWVGGGKVYGPRGPKSYFFMLSQSDRALGLRAALSVKLGQENLHIVDSLDLPTDEPDYLKKLIETRGWGLSVLFVSDTDVIPRNIAIATDMIKPYSVMPVYGLNVYSMLKHETLVLTLAAVELLEEKLLFQMHKQKHREKKFASYDVTYNCSPIHPK